MAWCGTKKAQWLSRIDKSSILVFDLETTGLNVNTAEILQIAITDGSGSVLFSSYVRPDRKEWKSAEKVNGITPDMVKDAPRFSEIRPKVQELFNKAKLIAGYNIKSYDIKLIERYGVVVPMKRFDVMEEFRIYTGRPFGYRLKDCAEYFNLTFTPHNAVDDAAVTACCMQQLILQPGFVNTEQSGHKKENGPVRENTVTDKQKLLLWPRLMKPLLKKRRFHPMLTGIFLMTASSCTIVYLTYGKKAVTTPNVIEAAKLMEKALESTVNVVISAAFSSGALMLLYGLIRMLIRSIRWSVNFIRKLAAG